MKNKNLIFGGISLASVVLLVLPMFLSIWSFEEIGFGLFADYTGADVAFAANGGFARIWGLIVEICAVVALVVAVAYAIFFVLEVLKVGKLDYAKLRRILAMVACVLLLVVLVCSLLFVFINKVEAVGQSVGMGMAVGTFMLFAGLLVLSVFGLLSTCKKNK